MALICSKCESHYLIEDYDQRMHYITGYHCGMCGSTKLIEEVSMSHLLCEAPEGCKKQVVRDRLCTVHYRVKHGISPKAVPSTKKPPLTPAEIAAGKICSIKDCGRKKLAEGLCYKHLSEKHGGVNPYKYPKKKIKSRANPFVYIYNSDKMLLPGDGVAMGKDGKLHLVPALRPVPERGSCNEGALTASLAQEVYEISDGNGRKAVIVFSFVDHPEKEGILTKEFAECRFKLKDVYDFDDWMFLGAISAEIKRIQEGA